MTHDALAMARRLALVAQNALLNGDLQRACSVLRRPARRAISPAQSPGRDQGTAGAGMPLANRGRSK